MQMPLRCTAVLLLLACGSPYQLCSQAACPSGCCSLENVCQESAAGCNSNPGTGGGGSTGGSTCSNPSYTVSGSLPSASATLNAYDSLVESMVEHKRDVDPVEDGCVANVTLTLRAAGQCELKVVAGGKKFASGALVLKELELTANSQCPGFLDAQEGVYENSGGLTTGELALSTATAPGKNVATSCLSTQMTLKLAGTMNRKTDGAALQLPSSQLSISGQFNSLGDVMLRCPELCTGNCLPQQHWQDPVTNLKWEHPARFALTASSREGSWADASAYCAALTTGGVAAGTWRMPSIDELRTLVRNNPETQPGGACKVCTTCAGSCLNFSCYSACDSAPSSSSCVYAPPELGPGCTTPFHLWSSTPVSDRPGGHWTLQFYDASMFALASEGGVRCVRN